MIITRRMVIPSTDLIGKPEIAELVECKIISSLKENIIQHWNFKLCQGKMSLC